MAYLWIGCYGAACFVHLFFCWRGNCRRGQDITKILLMPLLLLSVFSTGFCPPLVLLALFFGWLGDILLLRPDRKPFFLGGLVSFLIGHACYIPALLSIGSYSFPKSLLAALVLLCLGGAAYASLYSHVPRELHLPVVFYLLTILGMAYTALHTMETLLLAGAVCFVCSDYILARALFIRRARYSDFIIMLTYLTAQFCLAWGLCGQF